MATDNDSSLRGEDEPLLGNAGDASQVKGVPMYYNLFIGTGILAQFGIWILFGVVWGAIFTNEVTLFEAHPLLNMAGVLIVTQGILILQPTHTGAQKTAGTWYHLALNDAGFLALIAGLVIIEYNKIKSGNDHFYSIHGILGLTTYIILVLQVLVGATAWLAPGLYGGVNNAKSIYKYHRMSGYVALLLLLATVCAATQVGYNTDVLHIRLWGVLVASIIVVIGIFPRIKKQKLGF